ncbi:MAG TPA: alginate export family protein, partial [Fodinibius sp.]|nr:alginate export family protein [Fodinibius sp.]
VRFSPYEPLSFSFSSYFFWRQQTEDHLYYMSGRPYQEQVTSRKKYIGTMPEMVVEWTASRHISAALEAEYLFVGPFLESIDRQNMAYIGLKLGYTF